MGGGAALFILRADNSPISSFPGASAMDSAMTFISPRCVSDGRATGARHRGEGDAVPKISDVFTRDGGVSNFADHSSYYRCGGPSVPPSSLSIVSPLSTSSE